MLSSSDWILSEDTRRSSILLKEYNIRIPLRAFHQHNEKKELGSIVRSLEMGKVLSLISDAGTPLIADPGQALIQACIEKEIPITAIPGPCSPIVALTLSGFATNPFQFIGFLPKSSSKLLHTLKKALYYPGTTVCFESPERLVKTLTALEKLDSHREIAVCRELTKVYEQCL